MARSSAFEFASPMPLNLIESGVPRYLCCVVSSTGCKLLVTAEQLRRFSAPIGFPAALRSSLAAVELLYHLPQMKQNPVRGSHPRSHSTRAVTVRPLATSSVVSHKNYAGTVTLLSGHYSLEKMNWANPAENPIKLTTMGMR